VETFKKQESRERSFLLEVLALSFQFLTPQRSPLPTHVTLPAPRLSLKAACQNNDHFHAPPCFLRF
ncbi:hypothetical protein ACVBEH_25895, partial [Roseateles sp. GG27B]